MPTVQIDFDEDPQRRGRHFIMKKRAQDWHKKAQKLVHMAKTAMAQC